MKRVRFAPSPTGTLHIANALSAVANRSFGDWMLLRIDDTDLTRNVPGWEEQILADLEWLGLALDEGPVRQSERGERYREAAAQLGTDRWHARGRGSIWAITWRSTPTATISCGSVCPRRTSRETAATASSTRSSPG